MKSFYIKRHTLSTTFEDLGLSPEVLKAIDECGYTHPTPIQEAAIPTILMMRDMVGLAQTGTGKTASFTLPMIEILAGGRAKARMPRSLILAPTRELAAQVAENFDTYGKYVNLSKALLVGGSSMNEQVKILERGVDVLIATPGRLLDLFERGQILLNDIKILVIDEADRMLDMGFIPDIEKIVSKLSPMRQTLLFSATMAPEIQKLTTKFLSNPKEIAVAPPASTAKTVEQFMVWTEKKDKERLLESIIHKEKVESAFIFCNRKRDIAGLEKFLQNKGYSVKAMHGDLPQSTRTEVLAQFKAGEVAMLVCSDVAARGIDVSNLSHVFNFDVPMNADDYVHRIGRTGRAGKSGRAWMLATSYETKYVDAIEKKIGNPVPVSEEGKKSEGSAGRKSVEKKSVEKDKSFATPAKKQRRSTKPTQDKEVSPPITQGLPEKKMQDKSTESPKGASKNTNRNTAQNTDTCEGFGDDVPSFFSN